MLTEDRFHMCSTLYSSFKAIGFHFPLFQPSVTSNAHLIFFLLVLIKAEPLRKDCGCWSSEGNTCRTEWKLQPPAGIGGIYVERSFRTFLITESFTVFFLPCCLSLSSCAPLFISSEMKVSALVVVLAIVFSVNRSKYFSLYFSSLYRLVRFFVLKILIGY